MDIMTRQANNETIMELSGRFDFNAHRDFRNSYEQILKSNSVKVINLNMARVDYLDSSALGMLLLLNEKARAANIEIIVSACPENIRKIIEVANFGKIFKIV